MVAKLVRHPFVAALIVVVAVLFSVWDSHHLAAQNDAASIQRSIDNCRRANPSRAYLRLRAIEFKRSITTGPSYTTKIAPRVYAILNCRDTVKKGYPIALPRSVQEEYMDIFRHRQVPITRGPRIVGQVSFRVYFTNHPSAKP